MEKIKTIATGGFFAGIIAIGLTTVVVLHQQKAPGPAVQGAHTFEQDTATKVSFIATRGKNVVEQLATHARIQTDSASKDQSVVSINGHAEAGKNWHVYVNDQLITANPATHITSGGEKIEWKLE